MKRKRGRPKGSTKKPSAEEELAESAVGPSEDSPPAPGEGSGLAPSSLECSKCCRKFSNPRQLRKHICIIVLNLDEEDGEAGMMPEGRARRFLGRRVSTDGRLYCVSYYGEIECFYTSLTCLEKFLVLTVSRL